MEIIRDYDLTARNTFGMKVHCACLVEYDSVGELEKLYAGHLYDLPKPVLHIGGGSNLLFTKDFPGTVFHSRIRFIEPDFQSTDCFVEVGAGVVFDDFCGWAAENNLWGAENLSYIPGETGAAAVQNIGAYGVEVKDIIYKVKCFDAVTGRMVEFSRDECGYGYRESLFKTDRKGRYVVTSVVFRLHRTPAPVLDYGHIRSAVEEEAGVSGDELLKVLMPGLVRKVITDVRKTKLPEPSETGSAGSFFKNPVVPKSAYDKVVSVARLSLGDSCTVPGYDAGSGFVKIPAAWLIEQCGWKGYIEGNVGVYGKQPLVLVNVTGNASPDEVVALERKIIRSVMEKFDIQLHPEVEHV